MIPPYKSPFDRINDNLADLWRAVELLTTELDTVKKCVRGNKASLRHHVISVHAEDYMSDPKNALKEY